MVAGNKKYKTKLKRKKLILQGQIHPMEANINQL